MSWYRETEIGVVFNFSLSQAAEEEDTMDLGFINPDHDNSKKWVFEVVCYVMCFVALVTFVGILCIC